MESYLLFTNTSPQECSRKGFTLPQAAQFHLSGGIDKTKPLSWAKLLSLVVTAEDNNIHDIYGSACVFFHCLALPNVQKASCLLIVFHLFIYIISVTVTVLSIVHHLMDESPNFLVLTLAFCYVFVLNVALIMHLYAMH